LKAPIETCPKAGKACKSKLTLFLRDYSTHIGRVFKTHLPSELERDWSRDCSKP